MKGEEKDFCIQVFLVFYGSTYVNNVFMNAKLIFTESSLLKYLPLYEICVKLRLVYFVEKEIKM